MIKKIPLLFLLLSLNLLANVQLTLDKNSINNAQTALLILNAKEIENPKLTLMNKKKFNLNFEKNPFKHNSYYALIPISYYETIKKHKIIISFIQNKKKTFKSIFLDVHQGPYKKEVINVSSKKVKPKNNDVVQRTQKEYKEAMAVYNHKSKTLLWSDSFVYPLQSKITSDFGTKRIYNNTLKSYHSGTDFKAKIGKKILAVNSGIVKLASNRFYAGNSVVLDHGQGIYTCYFHLSDIKVKVGERVKRNQLLGLSGDTGRVTGPHLHFSARVHGVQVDPLQLIEVLNRLRNP